MTLVFISDRKDCSITVFYIIHAFNSFLVIRSHSHMNKTVGEFFFFVCVRGQVDAQCPLSTMRQLTSLWINLQQ